MPASFKGYVARILRGERLILSAGGNSRHMGMRITIIGAGAIGGTTGAYWAGRIWTNWP